jgi:hypothetical protein
MKMKLEIDLNKLSVEELKTVIKLAEKQEVQYPSVTIEGISPADYEKVKKAGRPKGVRNKKKKINKHWSTYELNRLKSMMTAQYSDKKIAKELNRTVPSVASMRWKIQVDYDRHNLKTLKPVSKNLPSRFKRWTDEEVETLRTMYKEGYDNKVIGTKLGRTAKSVDDKLYYIGLK